MGGLHRRSLEAGIARQDFPVFSFWIREATAETGLRQIPRTAISSTLAETSRTHSGLARRIPAIPRAYVASVAENHRERFGGPSS